jgi:hypothetical protein
MSDKLGLKNNARNPASIANIEHDDESGSKKVTAGGGAQVKSIVPASTIATAIPNDAILRIVNTTGSDQYVFIGKEDAVPGALNITNSLIMHGQSMEYFFAGSSDDDKKSLVVKTSSNSVQVAVLK